MYKYIFLVLILDLSSAVDFISNSPFGIPTWNSHLKPSKSKTELLIPYLSKRSTAPVFI